MNKTRQIEDHALAQFFYWRSGAEGIVVLTHRADLLAFQYPPEIPIYVAVKPWAFLRFKSSHPNIKPVILRWSSKRSVSDKVLVCLDYFEDLSGPVSVIAKKRMARLFEQARVSIISTTVSPEANARMTGILSGNGKILSGYESRYVGDNVKNRNMFVGGHDATFKEISTDIKVLAIIHTYNEEDIINQTIEHLHEQGVSVHVIDNWSTDRTYEIVKSLSIKIKGLSYERFPSRATDNFELGRLLGRVSEVTREKIQFDWYIINDADEIRWSPWPGTTLQQAIAFVDSIGYNAIDFTVFNFVPTKEGYSAKNNLKKFFQYGKFGEESGHFVQIKGWKKTPDAEIATSGGHHVNFPNQKIYPLKFLMAHYPIRSTRHGQVKILKERLGRYSEEEKLKGWHTHYQKVDNKTLFIENKEELVKFDNIFLPRYLIERISGIGIQGKK